MRFTPRSVVWLSGSLLCLAACGGGDSTQDPGNQAAGGAGTAGSAGQAGAGFSGGSGSSGVGGKAGASGSGSSGQSGAAGSGAGGKAGSSGASGQGGAGQAGQAGSSGQAGAAGSAGGPGGSGGISGASGQGGAGQAGQGGQAGEAGQAGAGGGGAGGLAGGGGDAGSAGQAGSGGGCNDPSLGSPCASGLPGACASGHLACVQNVLACVADVQPGEKPEVCDGVDNNCDGTADEGAPGANQPCTIPGKLGLCGQGTTLCDASGVLSCQPLAQPSPEVCDDQDNDCNGQIDNNPTDTGVTCDTGKLGACAQGVAICSKGAIVCSALAQPTPEDCNGIDDDCNGAVDDGLPDLGCGIGECATTAPSCLDGKPQLCFPKDPQAETCDGKDNNCDGQVDDGNVCCAVDLRCGDLCCAGGQVCSFQKCVQPGVACFASEDCASGEYCDYSLGTVNNPPPGCQGTKQKTGKCLPRPPSCAPGQEPGDPPVCVEKCEYKPPAASFQAEVKYTWGGQLNAPFGTDVMMTPIVLELDDDDCDGKVTERDIPEIVFTTFSNCDYFKNGVLHAISIVNEQVVEKWSVPAINPYGPIAGGNVDGAPGNEVIACGDDGRVHALAGPTGKEVWKSAQLRCNYPALADLDQDGSPEVIVEGGILDGKTGQTKATFSAPMIGTFAVSDLDGDGFLDIVTASQAFHADGTLFIDTGKTGYNFYYNGFQPGPAVADLDGDGKPEVIGVYFLPHQITVWRYDASQPKKFSFIRDGADLNGLLNPQLCPFDTAGRTTGGGPVTVGDFNADGTPDVALAGGVGYAVFDGKKLMNQAFSNNETFLWVKQTQDCSSAGTGSSLFDFNGDGKAEVVYADETRLRIYEGATGNVLYESCSTSGTLTENPVIADVDNDGHADIIAVSNACFTPFYPSISCNNGVSNRQSGVQIFGDKAGNWVRTRRIWNQHAYHVTNVNEDGSIPKVEAPNWQQPGLNNFRQNKQPGGEFAAPDLVVSVAPTCSGPYALVATLRNLGEAPVEAGVKVGFYTASGAKLGEIATQTSLYPAGSETLTLSLGQPPSEDVYAVADDGGAQHPWVECRTNNNKSAASKPTCAQ